MVNFFENFRKNFSAPSERGARTAAGGFALTGRLLSLHRLNGVRELPQAGSPLTGGKFFAEPQRRVALCGAREVAAPAAGAKRKGHLRFPFLFELLPFPCWDSLGADGRLRKQEKDAAVGLPQRVFLRLFAVHRQRTATHAGYSTQSAAYPCRANPWHVVTHGTCEDKLHRTPNP